MHTLEVNKSDKTANFDIHDQKELNFLIKSVNILIAKQEKKVNRKDEIPIGQEEKDKLARYQLALTKLKIGPIKLSLNNILDLENAVNEGITDYEQTETDNPQDEDLQEYKEFKKMLHNVSRSELQNRG